MQAGAGKTSKAMEAAAEAQKAKREAAMKAKGGQGAAQWIEIDMTGKPLEEVGREAGGERASRSSRSGELKMMRVSGADA